MLFYLYRFITYPLFLLMPLLIWKRQLQNKELPGRWKERLGITNVARPKGVLVWIHGASVGEINSVIPLIREIQGVKPQYNFLITTVTATGNTIALKQNLPQTQVQFLPMDIPLYVSLFLRNWHPNFAIFVDSELWPNVLHQTYHKKIPITLVNARISDRSFRKWSGFPRTIARLLGYFKLILPCTKLDQERVIALGAKSIKYIGHLKYSTPPLPCNQEELDSLKLQVAQRPVLLCSSIHAGEIEKCIQLHQILCNKSQDLLTIIAPRHPETADLIREAASAAHITHAQRSRAQPISNTTQIYIADTIGELGLFYRLCPIAFIGGSLIGHGGQNMLEPARIGCVPIVGPYTSNFAEIMSNMKKSNAVLEVKDVQDLANTIGTLLQDKKKLAELRDNGLNFAKGQGEILNKTANLLIDQIEAC